MKTYTLYDLGMNVSGSKYLLPFDLDTKDEEILEKTMALFEEAKIYECELYLDKCKKSPIILNRYNNIEVNGLYEGYSDYYNFTLNLEVFRFKCHSYSDKIVTYNNEEIKDGQWMISMYIDTGNDLLEELIDQNSIPKIVEKTDLKKYKYKTL
jgi:hypothetical protein